MKIKGSGKLRNPNPANPLKEEVKKEKKLVYYIDLDGTLAYYERWGNVGEIGEPVPLIQDWIKYWLHLKIEVVIFTARAYKPEAIPPIRKWLMLNGFPPDLRITNVKGMECDIIFDNSAREVINNTGIIVNRTGEFDIKKLEAFKKGFKNELG